MNRCRRCATVISGVIAAGVLYGGVGMVVVTPAWGDPAESGDSAGTDSAGAGIRSDSNATGSRRPRPRASSPMPSSQAMSDLGAGRVPVGRLRPVPDRAGADTAEADTAEADIWSAIGNQWPCHCDTEGEIGHQRPCDWSPFIEPIRPPGPAGGDNGSWLVFQGQAAVTAPVTQLAGGVAPELASLDVSPALPPAPSAAPTAAPAAVAAPAFVAPDPGPSVQAGPRRPTAAPLAGPASPASGPPPRTGPAAPASESVLVGYPEYLRQATMTELASVALPGLAAILGLTALGGLLGYRQAKAGYLLPAAGAGRFLR